MIDDNQELSDIDLIKREFADYCPSSSQGAEPVYFTTASWFALHECNHCGGEDDVTFIHEMDCIKDTRFGFEDTRHVFGFPDTADGIRAMKLLNGWLGLDSVYKRDLKTGDFQEVSIPEAPALTPERVKQAVRRAIQSIRPLG